MVLITGFLKILPKELSDPGLSAAEIFGLMIAGVVCLAAFILSQMFRQ